MNDLSPRRDNIGNAYAGTTYVYLDIETIPTQDPGQIEAIKANVKPPAAMKKAETIDAWRAEQGAAAGDEAVAKTSFDGGRGHVCTIAWAINDGDVTYSHAVNQALEVGVIGSFFAAIPSFRSIVLVGHNIAGFDLPFLRKRAICLGINLPPANALPRDPKAWDKNINDTMAMWAGARDTISLDNLCQILGIPGKDGMDGSKVAQAWADGRHDEIAAYCAADVERTRAVHQRFLAVGW